MRNMRIRRNVETAEKLRAVRKAAFEVGSIVRRLNETFVLPTLYHVVAVNEPEADDEPFTYDVKSVITNTVINNVSGKMLEEARLKYLYMVLDKYMLIEQAVQKCIDTTETLLSPEELGKQEVEYESYESDDDATDEEDEDYGEVGEEEDYDG